MTSGFDPHSLAHQARRRYVEEVVRGLVPLVQTCIEAAKDLLEKPAEHSLALRRRDLVHDLTKGTDLIFHQAAIRITQSRAKA